MFDRASLVVLAHKKLVGLFDISSLLPYYLGPFNSYTKKRAILYLLGHLVICHYAPLLNQAVEF
jgi:hypothetical protein